MNLTERQALVLRRLVSRNNERDGAESGAEIAQGLWHFGVFTSTEQGQRVCKQLAAKKLVSALGRSPTGAVTWAATDAGRKLVNTPK